MSRVLAFVMMVFFVLKEIIKAALHMLPCVLAPRSATHPSIVAVPLRCRTDLEITALAIAITVTPGTLTLGVAAAEGEEPATMFVHLFHGADRETALAAVREMESAVLTGLRGREAP